MSNIRRLLSASDRILETPCRRTVPAITRHSFLPPAADRVESIEECSIVIDRPIDDRAAHDAQRSSTRESNATVASRKRRHESVDARTHDDASAKRARTCCAPGNELAHLEVTEDVHGVSTSDDDGTETLRTTTMSSDGSAEQPIYAQVCERPPLELQRTVRSAAQFVMNALGPGVGEAVYRDALAAELQRRNVAVMSDREVILPIHFCGRYVGFCRSDMVLLCAFADCAAADRRSNATLASSGDESTLNMAALDSHSSDDEATQPVKQSSAAEKRFDREKRSNWRTAAQQTGTFALPRATLVIELKAQTRPLHAANVHQLLQYMRLLNVADGMLINFDQSDTLLQSAVQQLSRHGRTDDGEEVYVKRRLADSMPVLTVTHSHRPLRRAECMLVRLEQ